MFFEIGCAMVARQLRRLRRLRDRSDEPREIPFAADAEGADELAAVFGE
jgi:hypothetical protein